ncbi:hypothetical protein K2173_011172 [Erythroxylum novogranatense]|uniref:Uncharacterized protein n=1 Tax=Erythroxylum novogranatense TaxID=1862640 RepID=A0AAV8T7M5_9ROSI|nr:hypothetical protein K2173_011172 [Erythroxylum novogranatense]
MTTFVWSSFISTFLRTSTRSRSAATLFSISKCLFSTSVLERSQPRITVYEYLIHHQRFSPEFALKIPNSTTKYVKDPQNSDSLLSYMEEIGFSKTQIQSIIERMPTILSAKLEQTIKPKFQIFQDSGIDQTQIIEIVSSCPTVLQRSVDNRLSPSMSQLNSLLGSLAAVSKLLKSSRWILNHDLRKAMVPNIEFLKSCGINSSQIIACIIHFPHFLLSKPETIKHYFTKVEEMGLDIKSKMFLHAIRVLSSMSKETRELKLKLFRELGFSEEDILFAFRRAPQVFSVSTRKLTESIQFFLNAKDLGISCVVNHPELLTFSIEQRLKPRLEAIKVLESKNLLPRKPCFHTIFKMTPKKFVDKYVDPYSCELGLSTCQYKGPVTQNQ